MAARIALELSTAQLDAFCRQVRERERRPADALRTLTTLQAFVNGHAMPVAGQMAARDILAGHCEQLRASVLSAAASDVGDALARQSPAELAVCFSRLSRSGFAEAVHSVTRTHTHEQRHALRIWIHDWLDEVTRKSVAIPDAIDFRAAGITPAEYQAMRDVLDKLCADRLDGKTSPAAYEGE